MSGADLRGVLADGAGGDDPDRDGGRGIEDAELAHLTGWFRQRPTAFEFWEIVVTDRRLYWCRVGESFKSLLLRADVGGRGRERVVAATPDELPGLNDANFVVPLSALRRIDLHGGSLLRRASLSLTWEHEDGTETTWDLYNTAAGDEQVDAVESLGRDDRLSHVDVTVEPGGRLF